MTISLPPEIKELMTVSVTWEASGTIDGYGQWTYASPVTLVGWLEPHSDAISAGATAYRRADGTVVEPKYDLYLDGDNSNARAVKLWDRFTLPSVIGASADPLQAVHVETFAGPPFDNVNPWLVLVVL